VGDQCDSLLDGQRAPATLAHDGGRVLGPDVAELLAALDVDEQVRRRGRRTGLDRVVRREAGLAVVAVDHARPLTPGELEQRHRLIGCDHVTRHDHHVRDVRPGGLPAERVGVSPQRLEELGERVDVHPGERRVAEGDQPGDLVLEQGDGNLREVGNGRRVNARRPSTSSGDLASRPELVLPECNSVREAQVSQQKL